MNQSRELHERLFEVFDDATFRTNLKTVAAVLTGDVTVGADPPAALVDVFDFLVERAEQDER